MASKWTNILLTTYCNGTDYDFGFVILFLMPLLLLLLLCGDIHPNPGPAQNKFIARFTNIRGLRTNWDYLEHDLLASQPHIYAVSESKLHSKVPDESLAVPGYSIFRRDRPDDSGWGGLIVFYKDSITCTRMYEFEHPQHEMICLKLQLPGRLVFLVFILHLQTPICRQLNI